MSRIVHLSDVHFGRIAYPEIVKVLVQEINALQGDLIVVSGDLTQRARPMQFADAVAMLNAFEAPVLVVPGNHDVYAWWHRPLLRMFAPVRRYRTLVTHDLMPTFSSDDLAVLGINSAFGWTIKGGWIREEVRRGIASFFAEQDDGAFKVLVGHHHLLRIPALGKHDVARYGRATLKAAVREGVDLFLCGHLHISHVETLAVAPGHCLTIASAGTATSNRWREPQWGDNSYNVIDVASDAFMIEERRYNPEEQHYRPVHRTRFERKRPPQP